MKKIANYLLPAICLVAIVFSVAAFNKAGAATTVAAAASAPAGQPVDLTFAAEKALPSVVHIKYVQNSKIKTVDVQSVPSVTSSATHSADFSDAVTEAHKSVRCRLPDAPPPARA